MTVSWSLTTSPCPRTCTLPTTRPPPQLFVGLARLHQAGDAWIALEIDHLLALAVGPEGELTVEQRVPHGHQMRRPVTPDRRHLQGAAFLEEGSHLFVGHADLVSPAHAVVLSMPAWTSAASASGPFSSTCNPWLAPRNGRGSWRSSATAPFGFLRR